MEQSPKPGTEFHQSSVYLPDMRFTVQSPTHQSYQFIRGQGFIIPHMVDTTPHLLSQQSFHHIAKIVYRSKRPPVLKSPQRPGNAFPHHIIKKIQIAFIAGTMNHARTQDIDLFVIIRINFQFSIFNIQLAKNIILGSYLALPIRSYRSRHHIFSQHITHHTVCSGFHRTEEYELLRRRFQKEIKYLLGQSRINIKIGLGSRPVFRIMGFTSQMNNGIEFRKIPHRKRSRFDILPEKSLYHPLLFRSDNIQPVKAMTFL